MDTINNSVMQAAAEWVVHALGEPVGDTTVIIHTVTITLNGQHGGADVIIEGEREVKGRGSHGIEEFSVTRQVAR